MLFSGAHQDSRDPQSGIALCRVKSAARSDSSLAYVRSERGTAPHRNTRTARALPRQHGHQQKSLERIENQAAVYELLACRLYFLGAINRNRTVDFETLEDRFHDQHRTKSLPNTTIWLDFATNSCNEMLKLASKWRYIVEELPRTVVPFQGEIPVLFSLWSITVVKASPGIC